MDVGDEAEIEHVEPDIATVLSGLGHELRNPIHAIEGFAGLLADTELDADQRILTDSIRAAVGHLAAMVADVFDFARLDAGAVPIDPQPFDLRSLVEEVEAAVSLTLPRPIRMVVMIDPSLPARVIGDAPRVRQILANLLGNAVKYTEAGTVSLEIRSTVGSGSDDRRHQVFSVSDTGIGIPAEVVPRLFRPFERGARPGIDRIAGTGLGLAISLGLAEAMGGTIDVTSEVGVGSVFTLTLPLDPDGGDPVRPLSGLPAAVVGPHGPTAASYEMLLADLGAVVVTPAEADLVVVDIADGPTPEFLGEIGPTATVVLCGPERPGAPVHPRARWVRSPLRRRSLLDAVGTSAVVTSEFPLATRRVRTGRILVVEDDDANRRVTDLILTRAGHDVDVIGDGRRALEVLTRSSYDLVLLDCHLPGIDGFEVARAFRVHEAALGSRRTPIVAFTGTISPADRSDCFDAGMDDVLGKPAPGAALLAVIERWLEPA
ncbi:MAG: ATP-binding protein [Ilumatobacteraceae bacterium]